MIVNGKDVNVNFRKAEEIQRRMNPVDALPETLKVEASQKEIKELENFDADSLMNADFSFQNNNTTMTQLWGLFTRHSTKARILVSTTSPTSSTTPSSKAWQMP